MLITVEQLRTSYNSRDPSLKDAIRYAFLGGKQVFDEELIQRRLKQHLENLLDHDLGKAVRPWQLVNISKMLDPNQPWVGIEYETGYNSKEKYQQVINYLWRYHDLTAVDAEGCGNYPCEITFSPVNFDDFMDRSYHMDRLLDFMQKKRCTKAGHQEYNMIGTHCNISTPAYRKMAASTKGKKAGTMQVCTVLNNSISNLSSTERRTLFGRNPYGTFFRRGNKYGDWLEGKLFDSVGSKSKWAGYKKVIANFCDLIETLSQMYMDNKLPKLYKLSNGNLTNDPWTEWYSKQGTANPIPYEAGDQLYIANLMDILTGKVAVTDLVLDHNGRDNSDGGADYRDEDRPRDFTQIGETDFDDSDYDDFF